MSQLTHSCDVNISLVLPFVCLFSVNLTTHMAGAISEKHAHMPVFSNNKLRGAVWCTASPFATCSALGRFSLKAFNPWADVCSCTLLLLSSANFSIRSCMNPASRLSLDAGMSFTQPHTQKYARCSGSLWWEPQYDLQRVFARGNLEGLAALHQR